MHSAEHILNQTMDRMFNCGRCFNAHIEKKKSKCDYHFERPLIQQEVEKIQTRVNRIIKEDLKVTEDFLSKADAMANYNTDKLPGDSGDTIRIVHRHFPMDHTVNPIVKKPFYIGSGKMALLAIFAASKGKFFEMNDLLFDLAGKQKRINLKWLAEKTGLKPDDLFRSLKGMFYFLYILNLNICKSN